MRRVLVVYNPRSSRYAEVRDDVLDKLKGYSGLMVGKYEVEDTDVDKNAAKLAELLKDGDTIIAAGGDATAAIAANGIMISGKDIQLGVLPYGNFNDLSRTLGTKTLDEILGDDVKAGKLYPLEILVDGKFFRFATCYVTIGMTAEAVEIFDHPKVRKKLKTGFGRKVGSYISLAGWYFKNRRRHFLATFSLNGKMQHKKTTDYAAMNGKSMARVMKGGDDYKKPKVFRSETDRLGNIWRLFKLMVKSILVRVPGSETVGDTLEFLAPSRIEMQAEGEYRVFDNVRQIEVRKSKKWIAVIEN